MKSIKLIIIFLISIIPTEVSAQSQLLNFINDYKTSIELPEYYQGKQLMTRSPMYVSNMYINNGILFLQYTSGNQSYTNSYFVEINLKGSEIKKGDGFNYNVWFSSPGNIMIRKTGDGADENLLMDWFTFSAKSEGMRERIYKELVQLQSPYRSQPASQSTSKTKTKTTQKKSNQSTSKTKAVKSKSGKYGQ